VNDRSVRSLTHLQDSASTARVLNLHRLWRRRPQAPPAGLEEPTEVGHPLFTNSELDRAIIIKHRLRRDELDLFATRQASATKVVLPIDAQDLKLGGRSFFVGERRYAEVVRAAFGDDFIYGKDHQVLLAMERTPSLDPFLLRERLKLLNVHPARWYLEISPNDVRQMASYVEDQIKPLVAMSFGDEASGDRRVSRLAGKILSADSTKDLEPLRETFRMTKTEYVEGAFCWKGFLYYKWRLASMIADVEAVSRQLIQCRPFGETDTDTTAWLTRCRYVLSRGLLGACANARSTLNVYDEAYTKLVERGQPHAFREFLLNAPDLFNELGERLGVVSHIVTFWRYRFRPRSTNWSTSSRTLNPA
jgi:hypothetical protein